MKKIAFFCAILLFFCIFSPNSVHAQGVPVVLGAVLEVGSGLIESDKYDNGIVRITPFAGVWINGIGFARVGINTGNKKEIDQQGASNETRRLDISTQIGFSAIGPERPYIAGSFVRSKAYYPSTEVAWNEWGLGIGHRFSLSPFAAIVIEAEHRWITEHYNRELNADVSGRRLQINFGLVAQPF